MQQPKSLCSEFRLEKIHACDVAAWSIEVGNEAEPNRVAADREDDRRPETDFSTERGDCPFITVCFDLRSSDIGGQADYKFSAWIKSIDFERATKLPDS